MALATVPMFLRPSLQPQTSLGGRAPWAGETARLPSTAGDIALLPLVAGTAAGIFSCRWLGRRIIRTHVRTNRGHFHHGCARWALPAAAGQEYSDNYVPVAVKQADGSCLEIDVRLTDTVRVLKAMVAVELGVPEEQQELSFDGTVIEEGIALGQIGIQEGSALSLQVQEIENEEAEPAPEGEACMRIFVKCDAGAGKAKRLGLDVAPADLAGEVKKRAFLELRKTTEAYAMGTTHNDFGLFLLQSPGEDSKGQLRYLKREERVKDRKTMEENGIKGGEELFFASLFWCEA